MRSIPITAGLLLIGYLAAEEAYDFFAANDGVQYFASSPVRLAYAGCIAVVGGILYAAFFRLPRRIRKVVYLAAVGVVGLTATAVAGFLGYMLIAYRTMLAEAGLKGALQGSSVATAAFSVCVWMFFYCIMTSDRKSGQPSAAGNRGMRSASNPDPSARGA